MKLLTKKLEKQLPRLYAQDGKGNNAIAYIKFFHPFSTYIWYATEYDKEEKRFFGLVKGQEQALDYFTLKELEELKIGGLGVERDMYFVPTPLLSIKELYP